MTVQQVSYGSDDGACLGQSSTDKIAFYGATPIVKTSITDYTTTTASSNSTPYGYTTSTQATALNAAVVAIMARGKALGLW